MKWKTENEIIGLIKYKVGDKIKEIYNSHGVVNVEKTPIEAVVIYVHPKGRFYTVEFNFGGKKVRESYTVRSDINPVMLMR